MERVLGVDSGGTKTILAVAGRDGSILHLERSRGLDPGADPDWPERLARLFERAGHSNASVFGLPCHGENEAVDRAQQEAVRRIAGPAAIVENDVRVAFDGAFAGGPGVLLLAGTGSMAWASDGSTHLRVGGWGSPFADEGSAHWIGREALSAALASLDGRCTSPALADAILGPGALSQVDVFDRLNGLTADRARVAALARTVGELAEAGDATSVEILRRAAGHLADHVLAAKARLGDESLGWSHAGGAFASRILLDETCRAIGVAPRPPVLPPVGGAILRAAALAGWSVDDAFVRTLAENLARSPIDQDRAHF